LLQEEAGKVRRDREAEFGDDRKLCKKNITDKTKWLIDKLLSKKRSKDNNYQAKVLHSAKETEAQVRLDFEKEEIIPGMALEDKPKFRFSTKEKHQFETPQHQHPDLQRRLDQVQMNKTKRMYYKQVKGIEDIERALDVGSRLCRSSSLKVGIKDLRADLFKKKKEIRKHKLLI